MGNNPVGKLKQIQTATQDFIEEKGIESSDQFDSSWWRRTAHFWLLVGKSFWRNRCPVRASALAYTTLLALIPVLAVAVSVTTSLLQSQGEQPISDFIDYLVTHAAPALNINIDSGDVEVAGKQAEVVTKITGFIGNIRSGALGLTGTIALVFVAISLLRTIEAAFNEIWGVNRGRSWMRSSVQYWAALTLGPIILVLAIGLASSPYFAKTGRILTQLGMAGALSLRLMPFVVVSLAFALFYQLMPNTRVRWTAALVGGLVGGCLWQLNNIFSVIYVSRVVSYSKIYGSLGIIPIFLVGLYFSWLIVLFGAQVAYAFQNRLAYLDLKVAEAVNQSGREFVGLRIMSVVAEHFRRGARPPSASQIASSLGVSSKLVSQILQPLVKARLLVEAMDGDIGYVPSRPLGQITLHQVLRTLRTGHGTEPATKADGLRDVVRQEFDRIRQAEQAVAASVTLQDLVEKPAAAPETVSPVPSTASVANLTSPDSQRA